MPDAGRSRLGDEQVLRGGIFFYIFAGFFIDKAGKKVKNQATFCKGTWQMRVVSAFKSKFCLNKGSYFKKRSVTQKPF